MKLTKLEKRLLAFCALVILVFSYLLYDDSIFFSQRVGKDDPIAELVEKKQDVRFKFSDSFSWTTAHQEEKLFPFDSIFTGDNSRAVLKLKDGSTLEIESQSLVVLSTFKGQLVLELKSGSLSGDLNPNANLLLKTKAGFENLNGRDGKQFRLERSFAGQSVQKTARRPAAEDQILWKSPQHFSINKQDPKTFQGLSWLTSGSIKETVIEISSTPDFTIIDKLLKTPKTESGIPMDLPDGSYFVRLKGYNGSRKQTAVSSVHSFELMDKKRSLLPPPVLLTQNIQHSDTFNFPPVVKWENVDVAENYRVELSDSPRFDRVVQYETAQNYFPWDQFKPGTYFVRLYSLADKETSVPSEIGTIEINTQAPILKPIDDVVIRTDNASSVGPQRMNLQWIHKGMKDGYRVEISKDGTFRDAQVMRAARGPASLKVTEPGQYHVRVFATDKEGQRISPPSNVEVFKYDVKSLLSIPQLVRPFSNTTVFMQQEDTSFLWLNWRPVPEAEVFQVEIAKDPEFTRIIASDEISSNRYLIGKKIPLGEYYWRVKSVSKKENAESDWSRPNKFYLLHKKREIFFE